MEQHNLQSNFKVIYRVNADEQARDAIIDRERFLRDQRTQQDIKKRLEAQLAEQTGIIAEQSNTITEQSSTITEQNNTITEQSNTITEQRNTIAEQTNYIDELKAKIAEYEAKLAAKSN